MYNLKKIVPKFSEVIIPLDSGFEAMVLSSLCPIGLVKLLINKI